jgi:flagellar hook-associated protein 3 FlgL
MQRSLSSLRASLDRASEVAITGVAITRTSDGAGRWADLAGYGAALSSQETWASNADRAAPLLDAADGALGGATDLLSRAKELAVQLGSETYSDEDRAAAVAEVAGLREELLARANTELTGRHVFAGAAYDAPAYDDAGTYLGDAARPSTEVGARTSVPTAFDGSAWFDPALRALDDLATALGSGAGSGSAVAATLDDLGAAHAGLVQAAETVGRELAALDDVTAANESLVVTLQEGLTALAGADPVESYTRLSELQTAYEAALQVTAGSLSGRTLFDFLR